MRRLLALLLGTVLVAGGVFALLLAFNARDDAGVSGSNAAAGPGQLQPDLGSRHLEAGQHVPLKGLTDPPTSGAHHDRLPTREGRLGFGLLGDYDAMPDLEEVAADLERSIDELAAAAGIQEKTGSKRRRPAARRKAATT